MAVQRLVSANQPIQIAGIICLCGVVAAASFFLGAVLARHAAPQTPSSIPLRILCLGDSITWGSGSTLDCPSYRTDLRNDLAPRYAITYVGQRCYGYGADGPNEGHGGWNTHQLLTVSRHVTAQFHPDAVLLMIGLNDFSARHRETLPQALKDERHIIESVVDSYSGATLDIASFTKVEPGSTTYDYKGASLFCSRLPALCQSLAQGRCRGRIVFVDMRNAAGLQKTDLCGDGVHPNTSGYAKIARVWAESIKSLSGSLPAIPSAAAP